MEEHFFKFSNLSNFSELAHGISNRSFGEMGFGRERDADVLKNREQFLNQLNINLSGLIMPNLVHSVGIAQVGQTDKGKGAKDPKTAIPATDGLVTSEKEIYLAVTIADCLPILIYDPILKIICVLHAGWRGIIGQIVPHTIEKLKGLGVEPRNLVVGVGPGICQKHFVVKRDVLSLFLEYYPSATLVRNNDGYVDLKKTVIVDLKNLGVPSEAIEVAATCTVCDNGVYGSYRKEQDNAPAALAVVGLKSEV